MSHEDSLDDPENKNKNEGPSLYNDIDPAYGYDAVTYDAVNDEYLEIVND